MLDVVPPPPPQLVMGKHIALSDASQPSQRRAIYHNKEIAASLFLGVSAVEMHLSRVYRKLGLRSRTARAARRWPPNPAPE